MKLWTSDPDQAPPTEAMTETVGAILVGFAFILPQSRSQARTGGQKNPPPSSARRGKDHGTGDGKKDRAYSAQRCATARAISAWREATPARCWRRDSICRASPGDSPIRCAAWSNGSPQISASSSPRSGAESGRDRKDFVSKGCVWVARNMVVSQDVSRSF